MIAKPLYIFDIDGTMALIGHRVHFLEEVNNPNRWREFYAACDKDEPNMPIIRVMESLRITGADIWFFSGRSEEVRDKTIKWLSDNTSFMSHDLIHEPILTMREEGDYTADNELKESWLHGMLIEDIDRIVAVFDDRDKVVDMWRLNNITCFQVADGNF